MKRSRAKAGTSATPLVQRMALVLAGGNALGSFEAGAYQALHDQGLRPDWVVGTSIGAVNGAIIAGNPPERRREALWEF
nr:patatin-like phospholipase family protein [Microvirga massiliensis]